MVRTSICSKKEEKKRERMTEQIERGISNEDKLEKEEAREREREEHHKRIRSRGRKERERSIREKR